MRVLALDPGQRVGWATAQTIVRYQDDAELVVMQHGIAPLKDAAVQIHKAVVLEDRFDAIVYETFLLTARGAKVMIGSDLQTAQFVGMIRFMAWLNPRVVLVPQGPAAMSSARKSLTGDHPSAADIRERLAKLPKAHDDSHDGSALLHLWNFFWERYV